MKILVIQQKMIGDVLVSSVICNNLKLMYPDAQINYLIYPFTKPVVENNPNIDSVILFEEKYRKSKIALLQFLLSIRKRKYDLVIDVYGKLESNLVVFFSGAKTKIGFHKKHTAFLYTKTIDEITKASSNAGIAIDNRLNLIETLSPKITLESKPKIYLTPEEIENGRKILEQNNIDFSTKIYMIGVLGSGATKTYPSEYMASLLDLIVAKTNATLLFNYIPSQKKEAKAIYDLCKKETQKNIAIELIPRSIREFLSITSHCNALIGNEGGAVNMAKAIGKPTFTIFSTWIIKEAWNSFEDEKSTVSVHLKDFKPDLYGNKSAKEMKNQAMELYHQFTPDLIFSKLEKFVALN
jgi:ADP-heptose:LPS heptosyltransferase